MQEIDKLGENQGSKYTRRNGVKAGAQKIREVERRTEFKVS